MSDQTKEQAAAEDIAQYCHCAGGACSGCEEETKKIFLAGVSWRDQNPSAEVEALVEALEDWQNCSFYRENECAGKVLTAFANYRRALG